MNLRKVTIVDVAQQASVSVTTVSLVLSGKGRISRKTADKVNAAIEELGYVRNQQAATLRDNISNVIGLIVKDITEPFYAEVAAGVSEYAETQGKQVFLTQCGNSSAGFARSLDSLIRYGVDGVIVGGGKFLTNDVVERINHYQIPMVCAARASEFSGIDVVRPDNASAARMATEYLIKNGHRQIAYFGGESDSLTRAERVGGYCSTLVQYGLPFRTEWIVETDNKQQNIIRRVSEFMYQYPKVSAIVCHNTGTALGAYFAALSTGNTVRQGDNESYFTQEIALVGFDDIGSEALYDIPVAFITQPSRDVGRSAATRLLRRIGGDSSPPASVTLSPGFSQLNG
ncbi:Mal regulon transcriptional regulator MalI [Morganella morganii]|nr:Mal regulon transcriptional regulator MalI [Morganella morganii]